MWRIWKLFDPVRVLVAQAPRQHADIQLAGRPQGPCHQGGSGRCDPRHGRGCHQAVTARPKGPAGPGPCAPACPPKQSHRRA